MSSFGFASWSRFLRSYTMRAAEFIVISRCLLYKRGPYKLTDKARDFHGHWKSIPYFLGISFKLSKPPYATGKSLRKLTKIEMAFYQKRKASFSSSLLSKFKSLIKLEQQKSSSKAGRIFVTGHHVENSRSHVKKRCNSSQTFAKWRTKASSGEFEPPHVFSVCYWKLQIQIVRIHLYHPLSIIYIIHWTFETILTTLKKPSKTWGTTPTSWLIMQEKWSRQEEFQNGQPPNMAMEKRHHLQKTQIWQVHVPFFFLDHWRLNGCENSISRC